MHFGVCANANQAYGVGGAETKDAGLQETSAAIDHKPRKATGRGASAPRSGSKSRSQQRPALTGLRGGPFNTKIVDPLARS